jgi:hypothetical protein
MLAGIAEIRFQPEVLLDAGDDRAMLEAPVLDQFAGLVHEIVRDPTVQMTLRLSPLLHVQGSQLLKRLHDVTRLGTTSQR